MFSRGRGRREADGFIVIQMNTAYIIVYWAQPESLGCPVLLTLPRIWRYGERDWHHTSLKVTIYICVRQTEDINSLGVKYRNHPKSSYRDIVQFKLRRH